MERDELDDLPLSSLTEEQKARYISPPYYDDPDIGRAEAWRWAYQGETTSYQYFSPTQRRLRQYGYVMYDSDRLSSWPEFRKPFDPSAYKEDPGLWKRNLEKMRDSWDKRSEWWQKGAQGYWSEEDSSRLVFPYEVQRYKVDERGRLQPSMSRYSRCDVIFHKNDLNLLY